MALLITLIAVSSIAIILGIINCILIHSIKTIIPENPEDTHSLDSLILSTFLDEVESFMYSKKLYPIIKPTDHDTLELLHQNPNTTDTFVVLDNIIIPGEKKGSFIWKKCMADVESAINKFIDMNKDQLVLEEIVND